MDLAGRWSPSRLSRGGMGAAEWTERYVWTPAVGAVKAAALRAAAAAGSRKESAARRRRKARVARVRRVIQTVGAGIAVGLMVGGVVGATLPWYGRLGAGAALGMVDRAGPVTRIVAGLASPLVGVGASVAPAIRAGRPERILYSAGAYYSGRWALRRLGWGRTTVAAMTWRGALEEGVWF